MRRYTSPARYGRTSANAIFCWHCLSIKSATEDTDASSLKKFRLRRPFHNSLDLTVGSSLLAFWVKSKSGHHVATNLQSGELAEACFVDVLARKTTSPL